MFGVMKILFITLCLVALNGCASLTKTELESHAQDIMTCATEKALSASLVVTPVTPVMQVDIKKIGVSAALTIKDCTDAQIIKWLGGGNAQ